MQPGRTRVRSRRSSVPDRLRRGGRRDRRRHAERRRPGEPARRHRLRDRDARRQRRRVRRGRQPLRLRRRHRPGARLPGRPGRWRRDGALPRPADGQLGRRRSPEPGAATPAAPPATQGIVANGLAFDRRRRALRRRHRPRRALAGRARAGAATFARPIGCDTTFTADTLCLDALFVQHPALDGADGIALDRAGNIWVDANERNAIVVVDRRGGVTEFFRNPVGAGSLRTRSARVPDEPGPRRDDALHDELGRQPAGQRPNTAGEASPGTAVVGKVSCLDQRLDIPGEPLPVD